MELVALLHGIFSQFDQLAAKYNLEKIKTIGDAYMVCAGLSPRDSCPAQAMLQFSKEMWGALETCRSQGYDIDMRVVAGVVGTTKFAYDVWGDTVNVASRMESTGVPGRTQVSEELHRVLSKDESLRFETRTDVAVKGKGQLTTYLIAQDPKSSRPTLDIGASLSTSHHTSPHAHRMIPPTPGSVILQMEAVSPTPRSRSGSSGGRHMLWAVTPKAHELRTPSARLLNQTHPLTTIAPLEAFLEEH